ncbi:hypothetical protein [Chryseobacterium luquanense]|uniref:Uncharacterized protein n=1 Tax=Chryseobacterium luquanense TaxID=2983766 RepID=A0ABT3Y925_9FLAO|nr:hypothetical protein [Chryseobacterium luquanense]MCX8534667.1 hypothetical protein [Chryseobacterium luquanense]
MLVFYLRSKREDLFIEKMLSDIFEYQQTQVKELLSEEDCLIRYENRVLDNTSEFYVELIVYIQDENKLNDIRLDDNIILGIQISNYIDEDVITNYKENEPYQWLLLRGNHFFLVEEVAQESYGINFENDRIEVFNISN